jgi:hypothetical protein
MQNSRLESEPPMTFLLFSISAGGTTFSNTKIYAAGGRYAGWIKDCEVDYVVLASNDFAVIASIILPAYNLDNDKCRVSCSMMERRQNCYRE